MRGDGAIMAAGRHTKGTTSLQGSHRVDVQTTAETALCRDCEWTWPNDDPTFEDLIDPTIDGYVCGACGYDPGNTGGWCALGCGSDYNRMIRTLSAQTGRAD